MKRIYWFEEGSADMRSLLGGKGANLAEMTNLGLPVPMGFVITTDACNEYLEIGYLTDDLEEELKTYLKGLEEKRGRVLGDPKSPLFVSVRSGAPISMPGMMDTILNLGLNDETARELAKETENAAFVMDTYERFIQIFGETVLRIDRDSFEETRAKVLSECDDIKALKNGLDLDTVRATISGIIVHEFKEVIKREKGIDFPQDAYTQLKMSVEAVFKSWNSRRATAYRRLYDIPTDLGTGVIVQSMVFGNIGNDSGTGVCFTRNPSTGAREVYGEYLPNAQGEELVRGLRTPYPTGYLSTKHPEIYDKLMTILDRLEKHFRQIQDIEFTIEKGELYVLQTRDGKMTPQASVKIAVDMAMEGLISKEEAIRRIHPQSVKMFEATIDPEAKDVQILANGIPASAGIATGHIVFEAEDVKRLKELDTILVRVETAPKDLGGLSFANGILTSRGGKLSHAAIVARDMGKPCVVGCEDITVDYEKKQFSVGDVVLKENDVITINGSTGEVMLGKVNVITPTKTLELVELNQWVNEVLGIEVGVEEEVDIEELSSKIESAQYLLQPVEVT